MKITGRTMNAATRYRIANLQSVPPQLNYPSMHRCSSQPPVTVMGTCGVKRPGGLLDLKAKRTGPARHAKCAPDFRRVLGVDFDCVVRGSRTLPCTPRSDSICRCARVGENPLAFPGKLERERVSVRVAGNIIRPNRRSVEDDKQRVATHPHVAARFQLNDAILGYFADLKAYRVGADS